jgi:hypothetical protein
VILVVLLARSATLDQPVRVLLLATLALLWAAAPAGAAVTPRFLGTGHDPGVAVDGAGTAHVAWLAESGGQEVAEYCQLPRGARTCTLRRTLPHSSFSSGKAQVLLGPQPGTVYVLAPVVNDPSVLFRSTDNGASFTAHPVGEFIGMEQALYGPGDSISIMNGGSVGAAFARYGLDGGGPAEPPVSFGSATESLDRDLTLHQGRLAAFLGSGSAMRSILWTGVGDPNAQQNWVEGPRLNGNRTSPSAASGRSGTFVAYVDRKGRRSDTYVRRLRGSRYRRPRRVSREDPTELSLAQGPRGDLALLWPDSDDTWFVRSRRGRRWTRPRRLVRGSDPGDLHAALGPRGGWVVWDGSPGNIGSHPIRVARIPRAPRN